MTTTKTAIWKTKAGVETPITEMVTPYLDNCISLVTRELAVAEVADREAKQAILEAMQAERATRTEEA